MSFVGETWSRSLAFPTLKRPNDEKRTSRLLLYLVAKFNGRKFVVSSATLLRCSYAGNENKISRVFSNLSFRSSIELFGWTLNNDIFRLYALYACVVFEDFLKLPCTEFVYHIDITI